MDEVFINTLYSFLLIAIRFGGLFLTTPMFSSAVIPAMVKTGLSLAFGFLLFPLVFAESLVAFPKNPLALVFQVGNELLIGVILGFTTYLIFSSFQLAGQFIDLRMGFALANVVDPFTGANAPLMGQFKNILALLLFLITNGHHQVIRALLSSFQIAPVSQPFMGVGVFEYIFRVGGDIFMIGFRLALPIVAVLFVVDVVFGFLARTVPQMNVFILGFPLKIAAGVLVLILSMPFMINFLIEIIGQINQHLFNLLRIFQQ